MSALKNIIFREKRNTRRLTPLLITETAIQRQMKTQLENVQKRLRCKFKFAIADAGYGSEFFTVSDKKIIVIYFKIG